MTVMSDCARRSAISLLVGMASSLIAIGCWASARAARGVGAAAGIDSIRGLDRRALYKVPSGSMEPTLPIGTRVAVKRRPPAVGTIVVFYPPEGAERGICGPVPHTVSFGGAACDATTPKASNVKFVKRIVAGPGDEIYVRRGHVYRKAAGSDEFMREQDPYIRACGVSPECSFPIPIEIPAGHWFLMGDNRGESEDSRFWGPVPTAWIVGTATVLECPRFDRGLTWVRRTARQGCSVRSVRP